MENEEIEGALPSEEAEEEAEANEAEAKALVEAEAEAEAEFEESLEGLSEEEKTQQRTERETAKKDLQFDYEAEFERERTRLGKKIDKEREKRLVAERFKGLSSEDAEKLIDERVMLIERRLVRGQAEQIASQMAGSDAEKNLILHHYDNSIIPSGNIEEDMDKAYALANLKRVKGTISELKKAAQSKRNLSAGSGAGAPIEQKPKKKYSQDILDGAKFADVSPEEFVKKQK